MRVEIGEPIDVTPFNLAERDYLLQRVRQAIQDKLDRCNQAVRLNEPAPPRQRQAPSQTILSRKTKGYRTSGNID